MIKAVLLDLDDTLIETHTDQYFPAYLDSLSRSGPLLLAGQHADQAILQTYMDVLNVPDSTSRLMERYLPKLAARVDSTPNDLAGFFQEYYREHYRELRPWIRPRLKTKSLLDTLFQRGYSVVIATNPGLPESATTQRMDWGGIPAQVYPFALITTLENMHFGKPHPEYFEEIMLQLRLDPGEAIMVGNDWQQDIRSARAAGLCTYWLTETATVVPEEDVPVSGFGSYDNFILRVGSGWLDTLTSPTTDAATLVHRLRAFPAAIDTVRRTFRSEILECVPADHEWSARDIICHLRDHEAEEDRRRLERILAYDNPFVSANYDPWAHAHEYAETSIDEAFLEFANLRRQTVDWLLSLPLEVWARPARYAIFGPTTFEEMVRFTTEHDLTHLRQMMSAIDHAVLTCGP
jgi:FMN phosphatase YigB (HAD superfamily)